jgi:hypothetical protein
MRVVVREGLIQLLVYFHADAAWIAFVIHFLWCFFLGGGVRDGRGPNSATERFQSGRRAATGSHFHISELYSDLWWY